MSHRTYRAGDGVIWNVWAVIPNYRSVSPALAEGWLAFESASGERRRLAPIPAGWELASDAELDMMRRNAVLAPPTPRLPTE